LLLSDFGKCVLSTPKDALASYAVFFPAFTFAHRALCAAAIFFRAAAESVRFALIGATFDFSRTFAHRAL
jgi:hypothetical protein